MRLFLALELPHEIRQRLADGSQELRTELPKARWVRAELMHLTLVFLGETDEARVPDLDREMGAAVAPFPRLVLAVTGTGAFPPRGRARVLWAGLEADGDLAGLQAAVAGAAERAVGWVEERKKGGFRPHLTLARCQPPWPRWAVDKLEAGFPPSAFEGTFGVDHVSLIASQLGKGPGGAPRYRTVSAYPLGGGP